MMKSRLLASYYSGNSISKVFFFRKRQPRCFSSTSKSSFEKVGVIGLGLMGHGICQVSALSLAHKSITAYEANAKVLEKGQEKISRSIAKLVSKNKLSEENASAALDSIVYTSDVSMLTDADFIVEAIVENMDVKKDLYRKLDKMCKPETIFASNTSSLRITDMANVSRPEKFVGVHFFNPVQIMKLVEVIKTDYTDTVVFHKAHDWVTRIGKVPVSSGDTPGFIVNRLLIPSLVQAMLMLDRGDATLQDIDVSMQLGAGHPMGPFHLADYIGLDTCYFILQGWVSNFPEEAAFTIPRCIEQKVKNGDFGRKSGKGFYFWDGEKRGDPVTE